MKNIFLNFTNRAAEYLFYLLAFLTPLLLTYVNYELFEFNKMLFVYGVAGLLFAVLLARFILLGRPVLKITPLLLPFLFFVLFQIVSTVFTLDRYTSLWGYYSRFHGGLFSTLSYLVIFYTFLTVFPKKRLKFLLIAVLAGAFFVAAYGFAEHFGIDSGQWVQDVKNRVFSTIGQPNWLAAYLTVLLPLPLALAVNFFSAESYQKTGKNIFFALPALGFFFLFHIVLLYTGSRSGFIAFWLSLSAFCLLYLLLLKKIGAIFLSLFPLAALTASFFLKNPMVFFLFWGGLLLFLLNFYFQVKDKFKISFAVFFLVLIGLTLFLKTPFPDLTRYALSSGHRLPVEEKIPGPVLDTGVTESGDIRKIVWQGALDITKSHPFIGTGVESFAYAYYLYRPVRHNLTSEWDFLYNKAHNEYLNFLATTGILGFGAYLSFILATLWYFLRKINRSGLNFSQKLLLGAVFSGWLSILITNFFGFSVVVVALFFYLIPAVFVKTVQPEDDLMVVLQKDALNQKPSSRQKFGLSLVILLCLFLETGVLKIWLGDYFFNQGYNFSKSEDMASAYPDYQKAIFFNPGVPFYHSELSYVDSVLAVAAYTKKDKSITADFTDEALSENNLTLSISPNNVNYWKTATKTYYELSQIDGKYLTRAIETLEKAQKLAPTDPKITYNLAVFYGKIGQNDKSIRLLQKSIQLKPNYKDAHYAIALFYEEAGNLDMAKKHLNLILSQIDPNDSEIKKKLAQMEGKN